MTRPRKPATHHGYVVIDKPAGWTSHDVVARVRRIVNEKHVGHAGTLDPVAVGVLPVAVGAATKTIEYLAEADKTYIADIRFGVETDSSDIEGTVTGTHDAAGLTVDDVRRTVQTFVGNQLQIPPMHSALKIDGKPLYERARKGEVVDIPSRAITILNLNILAWDNPVLRLEVQCSKGTYVRALARDIGRKLGTGAYLSRLVRTRVGGFGLADALSLDQLAEAMDTNRWERISIHPDVAMLDHHALVLCGRHREDWLFGREVPASGSAGIVRVYHADGHWLGVGQVEVDGGIVRPVKVVYQNVQEQV